MDLGKNCLWLFGKFLNPYCLMIVGLLCAGSAHAVFYKISRYYNQSTQQIVYLLFDDHFAGKKSEAEVQKQDLVAIARSYKDSMVIAEDTVSLDRWSYWAERYLPCHTNKVAYPSPLVLLKALCDSKKVSCQNIEFRVGSDRIKFPKVEKEVMSAAGMLTSEVLGALLEFHRPNIGQVMGHEEEAVTEEQMRNAALLDARAIIQVLSHPEKKVIFVAVGDEHGHSLDAVLPALGFEFNGYVGGISSDGKIKALNLKLKGLFP